MRILPVVTRAEFRPLVSFGLPVRNGAGTIGHAVESVLAQTLGEWELIISDNRSTDGTSEICAEYAAGDERIRHVSADRDLSIHENFRAAFRHSRGTYFRWHGDDDWLEPNYTERIVAALEATPDSVLCTTRQQYYRDGQPLPINDPVATLGGVDSADPSARVRALLRLFQQGGSLGIDPVYSVARRDVAARTGLQGSIRDGDFVYSCEMAMLGKFIHVPEVLAHRRLLSESRSGISRNFLQREQAIMCVAQASKGLRASSRLRISASLVTFAAREHAHGMRRRVRAMRHRLQRPTP
jgi:glycosyltransferase involved in cell wall biosynthesis